MIQSSSNKTSPSLNKKYLYWLLRDKYNFSDLKIREILDKKNSYNLPENIKQDISRLNRGEPLNYVIGWVKFCSSHINLAYKTLIPRPETEYLAHLLQQKIKKRCSSESKLKVLDLCCGSGCIGISLLQEEPQIHLDFVDIDNRSIKQTKLNLKLNNLNRTQFKVIKSDLFQELKGSNYDLIVSNPPYLSSHQANKQELLYEPRLALEASSDGTFVISKIISQFSSYLSSHGEIFIEIAPLQIKQIKNILKQNKLKNYTFLKDQFNKTRFLHIYT